MTLRTKFRPGARIEDSPKELILDALAVGVIILGLGAIYFAVHR